MSNLRTLSFVSIIKQHILDGELIILEILFVILSIAGVYLTKIVLTDVVPFPIFVTAWQMCQGLLMAYIIGEFGGEYKKFGYFPRVTISFDQLSNLILPTVAYFAMLVFGNKLLREVPNPALYPTLLTVMVIMHHLTRFFGCGEEYLILRWQSLGVMMVAFLIGTLDPMGVTREVLPWVVAYASASSLFKGIILPKIYHMVDGKGNVLHNNQHFIGLLLTPIAMVMFGELYPLLQQIPTDFTKLYSWQVYGCLVTISFIPFVKNIISNRLVKRTGQGVWRVLEIISVLGIFLFGSLLSPSLPNFYGLLSIILTVVGRSMGAIDVLRNSEEATKCVRSSIGAHNVPLIDSTPASADEI